MTMADPSTDGKVQSAEEAPVSRANRPVKGFVENFRRMTRSDLTDGARTPLRTLIAITYKRVMLPCREMPAQDAAGILRLVFRWWLVFPASQANEVSRRLDGLRILHSRQLNRTRTCFGADRRRAGRCVTAYVSDTRSPAVAV